MPLEYISGVSSNPVVVASPIIQNMTEFIEPAIQVMKAGISVACEPPFIYAIVIGLLLTSLGLVKRFFRTR